MLVSAAMLIHAPSYRTMSYSSADSPSTAGERPLAASFDTTTGASFRNGLGGAGGGPGAPGGFGPAWTGHVRLSAEHPRGDVAQTLGGVAVPPRWQARPFPTQASNPTRRLLAPTGGSVRAGGEGAKVPARAISEPPPSVASAE